MLIFLTLIDDEKDKQKFELLYIRNIDFLMKIALEITHNQFEAEDAVYSAFYKLAEKFDKYSNKTEDELTALCVTIVKHNAIDYYRRLNHYSEAELDSLVLYNNYLDVQPEEYYLVNESNQHLRFILHNLPESLYEVVDLKYYQHLSNSEIADILQIKKKTVEIRLYRAKEKLRKMMEEL